MGIVGHRPRGEQRAHFRGGVARRWRAGHNPVHRGAPFAMVGLTIMVIQLPHQHPASAVGHHRGAVATARRPKRSLGLANSLVRAPALRRRRHQAPLSISRIILSQIRRFSNRRHCDRKVARSNQNEDACGVNANARDVETGQDESPGENRAPESEPENLDKRLHGESFSF